MQLFRVVQELWFLKLKTILGMSSDNVCIQCADMNRKLNLSGMEPLDF